MIGVGAVVPDQVMEMLRIVDATLHGELVVVVGARHADGAVGHDEGHVVTGDVGSAALARVRGLAVEQPNAALARRQGVGHRRWDAAGRIGGDR